MFRDLPVDRLDEDGIRLMYWGIGRHFGTAVTQSRHGDLLGDVRDAGTDVKSVEGRGYTSRSELELHSDSSDITGLLVIRSAKSGGTSRFVSSLAIHNEIARRRPDLLEVLYRPFVWSRQNQEGPGEPPTYEQPIYGLRNGLFASRYIRTHIDSARTHFDAPPLTAEEKEALDFLDALTLDPEFVFEIDLEPGDLVFLNNHVTHHARTEFVDHDNPAKSRHLLRLWLSAKNTRPLPEGWKTIFRDCAPGAVRGGYPAVEGELTFTTVFPELVDPTIPPQPDNRGQA
jgi:hypothetical protein